MDLPSSSTDATRGPLTGSLRRRPRPSDRARSRAGAVPAVAALVLLTAGCAHSGVRHDARAAGADLAGAWRSSVQFTTGAFATIEDMEFMYVFNAGGTMTESSNYDAAPPVPPAYGVWRRTGPSTFEARYEFYVSRPPEKPEELLSGGWSPTGRGVLLEQITLATDGKSYTSAIRLETLDARGKPVEGGGEARGRAERLGF